MTDRELIRTALSAREQAYAPYSGFCVGAALLAEDGRVFTGCNVENASYPATCCAERTALFKAVSEGCRKFQKIALVGGAAKQPPTQKISPCGICRQALFEFGGPELEVLMASSEEDYRTTTLGELLPMGFGPQSLQP